MFAGSPAKHIVVWAVVIVATPATNAGWTVISISLLSIEQVCPFKVLTATLLKVVETK